MNIHLRKFSNIYIFFYAQRYKLIFKDTSDIKKNCLFLFFE